MNINDLTTVTTLHTTMEEIKRVKTEVNDGEEITLTIGGETVPITKPEIDTNARYQLNLHFDEQIELITTQLNDLGVTLPE